MKLARTVIAGTALGLSAVVFVGSIAFWTRSHFAGDSVRYETRSEDCTRRWYGSVQSAAGSVCFCIQRHTFDGVEASEVAAMYGVNAGPNYVRAPAAMHMEDYCKKWSPDSRCAIYFSSGGFFMGRNGWSRRLARFIGQAPTCADVASGLVLGVPYWFISAISIVPLLVPLRQGLARRSRRAGFCGRCDYDLRGTPNRCPECGETAAA